MNDTTANNDNKSSNDASSNHDAIQLDQFLKLHGVVQSGGEAKHLIKSGDVLVNGQVEVRRGLKLKAGDVVAVLGRQLKV
jgi:ribosome-associated protein